MQTFIAAETEGYSDKYDAALILANVSDFAQQGALRIKWSMPMGPRCPGAPRRCHCLRIPQHAQPPDVPMVRGDQRHTPHQK